jgi:hypothetical protein
MRIPTETVTATALLGLFIGAGSAAYAGTRSEGFDASIPRLQQPWESANQGKEFAFADGDMHVASVGSRCTINARMCGFLVGAGCGKEQTDLAGGSTVGLDAPSTHDEPVHLESHTFGFDAARVQATGEWRSN